MRRANAIALVLALAACSKSTAPIVTITGAVLTAVGAVSVKETKCQDGCVGIPPGAFLVVIGVPMFVIGGLSWIHNATFPDPPPPPPKPSPAVHP